MSPTLFKAHLCLLWVFAMAFSATVAVSVVTGGYLIYPLMLAGGLITEALVLLILGRREPCWNDL